MKVSAKHRANSHCTSRYIKSFITKFVLTTRFFSKISGIRSGRAARAKTLAVNWIAEWSASGALLWLHFAIDLSLNRRLARAGDGGFHCRRRHSRKRLRRSSGAFLRIDRRREYSHIIRLLQLPRISAFSPRHCRLLGKSMRARSGGTPTRSCIARPLARSFARFSFLVLRASTSPAIIAVDATYVR